MLSFLLCVAVLTAVTTGEDVEIEHDYMSDWSADWAAVSGRSQTSKCINIPANLTLCRGIGYTEMRLPNLLDHDTVEEASQQAKSWVPLANIRCHPDTKLFLCSLFSPICLNRPIWPCRTLCNAVKTGCEGVMLKYGFPWPEMLRCDKFPLDNDLCIGPQTHVKPNNLVCKACDKATTIEGIINEFCNSDFALKIQIRKMTRRNREIRLRSSKKKRIYKRGSLSKRDLKKANFVIRGAENCDCESISGSKKQFHLAMGRKSGNKMVLSFLRLFDKNSKDFRKAVRTMRTNKSICDGGAVVLTVSGDIDATLKKEHKHDRPPKTTGKRNHVRRHSKSKSKSNSRPHKTKTEK